MNNEIAIIYRMQIKGLDVEYIPINVKTGTYDPVNDEFIDEKGIPYRHLINGETYGYSGRNDIENISKKYPLVPIQIAKKIILMSAKKFRYIYLMEEDYETPIINMYYKNKYSKPLTMLDKDTMKYYTDFCPEIILKIEEEYNIKIKIGTNNDEEINLPKITEKAEKQSIENNNENINIQDLYKKITNNVIDQDEPIKKILTAIWKQYNGFSENKSRNILINGSTGVGKTEIFRNLTKLIDVPCVMTSATQYTAAGYVGKSVEDMLVSLLDKANGNIEKAQNGILIIDELDKLAESNSSSQVNQRDVQEALLKLIEDSKFDIDYHHQNINFDTSKLMVVGMGSWSRIKFEEVKHVGFGAVSEKKEYKDLTSEDIISNGMIPELIGRFPVIVQMNELDKDSFIRILNKSHNNALNLNKRFLERQGIKLSLDDETLNIVAEEAIKNKLGARSLDTIIEKALAAASFEIASNPDLYNELIITKETISDNKKYILKRKQ